MGSSVVCIEACNFALGLTHPRYEFFRMIDPLLSQLLCVCTLLQRTDTSLDKAKLIILLSAWLISIALMFF